MKRINRKIIIDTLIVTLLTYGVSLFLINSLSDIISIDSDSSKSIELSDVYNKISARQPVHRLNPDICIISTDQCTRNQIAPLIDAISFGDPKVIGLDIIFEHEAENDLELIEAINGCDKIVLPVRLVADNVSGEIIESIGSCFDTVINNASFGAVNFPTESSGIIRKIKPFFILGSDTVPSFSIALAKIADYQKYQHLKSRNNEFEIINYPQSEYPEYEASEIIDKEGNPRPGIDSLLKDKIVLISDTHSPYDTHPTPTGADMAGIEIHARALDTVLSEKYIRQTSTAVDIIISLLSCLLFSLVVVITKYSDKWNNVESLLLRILQLGIIYIFLVIGCKFFITSNTYINFSTAIIMMADAMLIADIWFGIKELAIKKVKIDKISTLFKKKSKKKS